MIDNIKKTIVALGSGIGYLFSFGSSPPARVNPDLEYKGTITLSPIDKRIGELFSYGFVKSTWLSGYDVNITIHSHVQDDREILDLLVKVLADASRKLTPTGYASETYLSPTNPSLYYVMINAHAPLSDEEKRNYLIYDRGVAIRVKGLNLCNDEEKKILGSRKYGVVWRRSIEEILASTSVEHSSLKIDPQLVFNLTDDDDRRSVALAEVTRINELFHSKGYSILDQRMLKTGLKNKGALREWFFEYDRYFKEETADLNRKSFNPEPIKKEWVKVARGLLQELNASVPLAKYREKDWDLKSLRFNLSYTSWSVEHLTYVTSSHFVIEYQYSNSNRILKRELVKIPLEEFYAWAEAELKRLDALEESGS